MASSKRGPSVLVTDARQRQPSRGAGQRPTSTAGTRFISVDNVLQYASDIPSGQPRFPPSGPRSPGGVGGAYLQGRRPSLGGGGLPTLQSARTGQQNMPSRTTKVSEKLVLLPDTVDEKDDDEEEEEEDAPDGRLARRLVQEEEDEARPLNDEELDVLRKRGGVRGKTHAERLPKVQRREKLARATAYCTAQAYKMRATAEFLRRRHEAKAKLYDDCLYVIYALPLLPGQEGHRVRSRPIMKTPGSSKTVLDLEIERSERRDHHEGYFDEYAYPGGSSPGNGNGNGGGGGATGGNDGVGASSFPPAIPPGHQGSEDDYRDHPALSPLNRLAPDTKSFAEMFVFSYGVVVFWNFTEHQEKDILADLTFARTEPSDAVSSTAAAPASASAAASGPGGDHVPLAVLQPQQSLLTRPLDQDDYETEEFHFEYSADVSRPRVFNDMITLLPRSDHMVKLTISHAIAQSTKLCFFEERMSATMLDAQHVPRTLALTGELNMTRSEIVKIQGRLFENRVQINLSSNVLDVPNFFWDSEPTLHPLYVAIREYLEIDPRIRVLNERCRVFLDLAEILSDSVADAKMSAITWIIIVLIVVSILITVTEVTLRFGILEKSKEGGGGPGGLLVGGGDGGAEPGSSGSLLAQRGAGLLEGALARLNVTVEELARLLSERDRMAICGSPDTSRPFEGL